MSAFFGHLRRELYPDGAHGGKCIFGNAAQRTLRNLMTANRMVQAMKTNSAAFMIMPIVSRRSAMRLTRIVPRVIPKEDGPETQIFECAKCETRVTRTVRPS
jgi:hypothetical protein